MEPYAVANTGAKLEVDFSKFIGARNVGRYNDFEILDVFYYKRGDEEKYPARQYPKAITIRDKYGNIYVHFNGTGDGNWGYNAAAYGGPPSRMQEEALIWFNETIKKNYEGQSVGNLYVTGHSQGGNNAQFVTMRSSYGDYITNCISLDGPGFSTQFVKDSKNLYGEAHYERQRNKIWAYNGENDFVSCLGQESIIPDNNTKFIQYTNPNKKDMDIMMFHMAEGLLDENGNIKIVSDDSKFRKFVVEALGKVNDLPPEQQRRAADIVMAFCENKIGDPNIEYMMADFSPHDFEELKEILIPLVVGILADSSSKIADVLCELGMDRQTAEAIKDLVEHFNSYPSGVREEALQAIIQGITFDNGKFGFDWTKMDIPAALVNTLPILMETVLFHPEDIDAVIRKLGIDAAIKNWIKENPLKFAGICIVAVIFAPIIFDFVKVIVVIGVLADAVIRIIQAITWLGGKVKEGILQAFNAIKNAVTALSKWVNNWWERAGRAYASSNPYFKVDTDKLRSYAIRINNVNNRLRNLDRELCSLYWQVGFLDLWDIMMANLITGGSPTLMQVKSYLNNAAERFEKAENKARGNMGG